MKVIETDLPGCVVIEPRGVRRRARLLLRVLQRTTSSAEHGLQPQLRAGQRLLLRARRAARPALPVAQAAGQARSRVLEGEVWDVAVDIRRGSPTFGRWTAVVLSAENKRHFWIPEGFAHGFVTLSERAVFTYLCTATYDRPADAGMRWDDPQLGHRLAGRRRRCCRPRTRVAPLLADIDPETACRSTRMTAAHEDPAARWQRPGRPRAAPQPGAAGRGGRGHAHWRAATTASACRRWTSPARTRIAG